MVVPTNSIIDWTEIFIRFLTIIITMVLIPLIRSYTEKKKSELSADQLETVQYWVEVGVRWAKQWLWSETGQKKKEEVLIYVAGKLLDLGIDISDEDLDRIIEAVYERVKNETITIEPLPLEPPSEQVM